MTILEKVCCDRKFVNTEKVTESFCPSDFGYDNVSEKECKYKGIHACYFCWNREVAEEQEGERDFESMLCEYGDVDVSGKYR